MRVPFGHIYLQYAEPIGSGFRIFALLPVVLFIPYVIVLYRRFGRVDVRRLWVSAAFLRRWWQRGLGEYSFDNASVCACKCCGTGLGCGTHRHVSTWWRCEHR